MTKVEIYTYFVPMMERTLNKHILRLWRGYRDDGNALSSATVSKRIAGDARFLDRREAETGSFTARIYDNAIAVFDELYRENDLPWPNDIPRPSLAANPPASTSAASGSDTKAPSGETSLKTGGTDARADVPPHFSGEAAE
ncbi:MAG: hypothetical protein AAF619_13675 [Pseudomonadota bacterium]